MTKNEVLQILSILKVAYPNSYKDMTTTDANALVMLWERQFVDYKYSTVQSAIDAIISTDTSGFAPSVGKVKEMINKLTTPDLMTEQEAWGYVFRALRNSGYHAKEEFEKLPVIVQRIVGNHNQLREWAMMPSDQINSVVASNFMRSFKVRAKHEQEFMALPSNVKEMLGMMDIKKIGN